jgi:hypothetical protein
VLLLRLAKLPQFFRLVVILVVALTHMPEKVVAVDVMHAGEAFDRALADIYQHASQLT